MSGAQRLAARGVAFAKRVYRLGTSLERMRSFADRARLHWRFRRAVRQSAPITVGQAGKVQLHLLFGHRTVHEAIATVQSLYRFTPAWPVVLHEDGSLTDEDRAFLARLLVGVRIIDRRVADPELVAAAEAAGLPRLAQLRRDFVLALKLLDIPFYSRGARALMLDTDVLFHRKPVDLLAALNADGEEWRDRYSEDYESSYAWDPATIREHTGIDVLPRVNTGLVALQRLRLDWERYERWLQVPAPIRSQQHLEQTLFALDFTVDGAQVLAPEYDVMFRASHEGDYKTWLRTRTGGAEVVAQHYCGGDLQRRRYYQHYLQHVAPAYRMRR